MFRKFIASLLALSMLFGASGCSSSRAVSADEYRKDPRSGIDRVVLTDGSVVEFDATSGRAGVLKDEEIVGFSTSGEMVRIPISKVMSIYYTETDTGKSVLLGGGLLIGAAIVGGVIVVALITHALGNIGK